MRIVQVVPLISDDNAFARPVSVALAQCRELLRRGHDVTLAAGWRGAGPLPTEVEGVPASLHPVRQLVPGTGFSSLWAPGLGAAVRGLQPHVAHLHSGRHVGTLGLARGLHRLGVPFVLQTHGMVPPSTRADAQVLDRLLATPALTQARRVFVLTDLETRQLHQQLGTQARVMRLVNGLPLAPVSPAPGTPGGAPEVLFISRLHERKRPMALVTAAALLRDRGIDLLVTILGPDEGQRSALLAAVAVQKVPAVTIGPAVPHEVVVERMRAATVFALPSVDEPFPMSILEALSVGTPVVVTTTCGLAPMLTSYDAGGVVEPTPEALADELAALLVEPALRQRRRAGGLRLMHKESLICAALCPSGALHQAVLPPKRQVELARCWGKLLPPVLLLFSSAPWSVHLQGGGDRSGSSSGGAR